jgi:UDP-N-acetyl-D-galactosamine dehydrogenase
MATDPSDVSDATDVIAVIGLGYVGLPVALAFGKKFQTLGFDISAERIAELRAGVDRNRESTADELAASSVTYTGEVADLEPANFFVVAVPTPIDATNQPDLSILRAASRTVGRALRRGDVVVYESTVFPGATEEICGPILEEVSGLEAGVDFWLGYSPERINPGDREHPFERLTKIVSGDTPETLARVARVYGEVIEVDVYQASSIKVAEAAKVIENTQRDLNIALMNELAMICDRIGIRTVEVIEAAATKWNFNKFTPGLVGGHCIGVDPYYLTAKAEELGYQPQVILAGRRINSSIGYHVAQKAMRLISGLGVALSRARIGIFGVTFKENITDIRNSRVPDIVSEMRGFGAEPMVCDPMADAAEVEREWGIALCPEPELTELDALILAVPHVAFLADIDGLIARVRDGGLVVDIKSVLDPNRLGRQISYWSL